MSLYRGDETTGTGQSVEDLIAGKVNRSGDTMTGALIVPAGAVTNQVPQVQEVVKKSGDTMTGALTTTNLTATGDISGVNLTATGDLTSLTAVIGDQGTEGSGINIGGVTYESSLKVSDIDGTNYAQTILHRHSTTLEPLIVGARSNSNTSSHTDVSTGQSVFSVYAAGWAGSNYKLFGSQSFKVGTGTVSNTSAPGKWSLAITPNGSTTPVETHYVDSDGVMRGSISNTPAGNISATTVQAAINELDSEKAKLAGDASQTFSVANGTGSQAINKTQADGLYEALGNAAMRPISSATASSSASVSFTGLSGASYRKYIIIVDKIIPAVDASNFYMRISTGSGMITTASYNDQVFKFTNAGTGVNGTTASTAFNLNGNAETLGTTGSEKASFEIEIFGADSTSTTRQATWRYSGLMASGSYISGYGGGMVATSAAVIDGIEFFVSGGNIASGTFKLYGVI